jgi:hypothetical protein
MTATTRNFRTAALNGEDHCTREADARTIVAQIGRMNLFAISGGRMLDAGDGVDLEVGRGYWVRIRLAANDTYIVQRVFVRAGKIGIKGELTDVYAEDLGELAYQASCFVNVKFGGHDPFKR